MNNMGFDGVRDYDVAKQTLMSYYNETNRTWTQMDDDLVTALLYTEKMVLEFNLTEENYMFTRNLPHFRDESFYYLIMYMPDMFNLFYKFPEPANFKFMSDASEQDVEAFGEYPHMNDNYTNAISIFELVDFMLEYDYIHTQYADPVEYIVWQFDLTNSHTLGYE